jgi:hypothetical protein
MGRRPIPQKDRKLPTDYPQFIFRVTKENKKRLTATIEGIQGSLNRRRKNDDPFVNKNDVIIRALDIGLKELRRK